ncbi:hypothetical protein K469DRAFT_667116 [Zopfia rhizophila CBS 207.26]|uniref:Uncharacterized protein n=1 Tax=Zopfia rhizophila CBS 207.26 TaxID=1314779 RepID=A0A6A6E3N0_9PEZI|nr:hypothetical protein K469DRAFT_667116 [Zopfia rhizophila CBS 207.26]
MSALKVEKLKDAFKPKPVFNRPVCTEKRARVSHTLFLSLLSTLVLVSTAVIGLKATTIDFIEVNKNKGFMFITGDPEPTILGALPRKLYEAPAKLAIVAGVISIFTAGGHIAFIARGWKDSKKVQTYAFRRNSMFLHLTNAILILLAMVSVFVTHKSTSHFRTGYVMRKADRPGKGVIYNIGTFDLETWSCELKTVEGARMVWEDYSRQCKIEEAGRMMMVPFFLIGMIVAALGVTQMIGCRREEDAERLRSESEELEMRKFNAI